jgi:phospholipid/cholesterol/gamma-HCH transport system substrate-binding protein
MSHKPNNFAVGLTALVGLVGLLGLLLLFGHIPAWMEGGYQVKILLSNASGLTESSRVRLSGIDVGRVTQVRLQEPSHRGVEVIALLRRNVRIPAGVEVKAQNPLLGGNPTLAFEIDHLEEHQMKELLPADGSAEVQGHALTLVSQFTGELEAAIAEPTHKFNEMARQFGEVTQEWTRVGENLNRIIESRSVEQVDAGEAPGNLTTVVARVDQRLAEMRHVIEGLDRWVNNPQLFEDVVATVADTRRVVGRIDQGVGAMQKRYLAVADDLSGVLQSLRVTADQAKDGKGTIGKLFHNPALYDNLNDAAQRLERTLDEVRLMVEKWKAEGMPVQF